MSRQQVWHKYGSDASSRMSALTCILTPVPDSCVAAHRSYEWFSHVFRASDQRSATERKRTKGARSRHPGLSDKWGRATW